VVWGLFLLPWLGDEEVSQGPVVDPELLVRALDDLHRGREAQLLLISLGEQAIEPLERFALVAVVRAADLGGLPLSMRLAEEAVQNWVARELGRLGDREAVDALLDALSRLRLIEAGRALLGFHETRAIPLLVQCLDDPFIRQSSTELLVAFGTEAVRAVVEGLQRREVREGVEVRGSNGAAGEATHDIRQPMGIDVQAAARDRSDRDAGAERGGAARPAGRRQRPNQVQEHPAEDDHAEDVATRRWRRTPRCAASCGATPARATSNS
jgi:HEAT repeat protein